MTDFGHMKPEEQQALVKKLGDLIMEVGLEGVNVEIYREMVCPLNATSVDGRVVCKVEKTLSTKDAEKAAKFKEAAKAITEGVTGVELKVCAQVGPGDDYATITEVEPMDKGDKVSIEHNPGEVILLDFWATWCPPCQAPMAHNQQMLEKRAKDWGDKVRIIGLSIDQDKNKLKSHVEAKKWTAVEHYFRAGSDASDVYGVRGVPHVMLIDTQGRIVFKGHPATRKNLEEDLDTLLKGEALTGEGVFTGAKKAEEGAAAAEEVPEGFKEVDAAAINEEIDAFQKLGEELQKDEKMQE